MVNPGLTIKLFDFQEQAVLKLLDLTAKQTSKQTVVMKAPTGSGKTIILIDYVDEYLTNVNNNTAFIWLCPGKGNLEEQSRDKMQKIAPHRTTQNLFDSLLNGFTPGSTTFINWELVTKKGNTAIGRSTYIAMAACPERSVFIEPENHKTAGGAGEKQREDRQAQRPQRRDRQTGDGAGEPGYCGHCPAHGRDAGRAGRAHAGGPSVRAAVCRPCGKGGGKL